MSAALYRIRLAKPDFKFSSAHFTIFGPEDAEPLHGHNYRVEVEIGGHELDEQGLLFDFEVVKRAIRARCAELDSRTLLPRHSKHLRVVERDQEIEIAYAERRYVLPAAETVLMPVANITIEELAAWWWRSLAQDLGLFGTGRRPELDGITELALRVEETDGQSCLYRSELDSREPG